MGKKKMKRIQKMLWMTGVFGVLGCLTACGQKTEDTEVETRKEPLVLDVWHQWQGTNTKREELTNAAIASYEEEHPGIKIEIHSLTGEVYKANIPMKFVGNAEDIDVFYFHTPGYMKRLVDDDKLLPLNDYLSEDVFERLWEGTLSETTIDDKIYGLPLYSSKYLIYCNRTLFEQAGVDLPSNFEELLTAGRELKKLGVTPLALGAQEQWLAEALYEAIELPQVGVDTVNRMLSGEISIYDVPEFRTAAEEMKQLREEGILGDAPLNLSEFDSMELFFEGDAAMLLDGTWASEYIDESKMNSDDVEVIDFPTPEGSRYAGSFVGGITAGSFFVNKNTDTPKEAADFAMYLTEYLGTRSYESGSGISCWKVDTEGASPTLKKIADTWDHSAQHMPCWDNLLLQKAADLHLSECQGLLMEGADVEEFLAAHDAAIKAQNK